MTHRGSEAIAPLRNTPRAGRGDPRRAGSLPGRSAFTLIELLVVVVIISVISGLLLPVFIHARDRARKVAARQAAAPIPERPRAPAGKPALPSGPAPILDAFDLQVALTPSYHRIGMDVFTRYRADCVGSVVFRHPGGTNADRVALTIPFPDDIVEARDVQITVRHRGGGNTAPPGSGVAANDVIYDRSGIHFAAHVGRGAQPLTADVRFTAFGRERFDYALPPARQLRSVAVTLRISGAGASWTIPDDSLQPSMAGPEQIRWEFRNLVSDRRISVVIPGAQAPLARVLLLSRLVAVAVLLFGAGFWFLSEQAKPGQLDGFRLGHFLLLALTYSLFFVIFAVLEFHGRLATPVAMAVSAAFSLPLLVLHVSRVLDLRFAITRVVPLALFALGLVVNGVYGGTVRDYVFIGAAVFVIAYATVSYQSWAAGRERHRKEQEAAHTARRRALNASVTSGISGQLAELTGADAQAERYLKSAPVEALTAARARLESAREPVGGLRKEYEDLTKRLAHLPSRPGWDDSQSLSDLESDADTFRERLERHLERLRAEVAAHQAARQSLATAARGDELHCAACGQAVPDAPFCPHCGAALPAVATCAACGERIVIPVHLVPKDRQRKALHCPRCGTRVSLPQARAATRDRDADPGVG